MKEQGSKNQSETFLFMKDNPQKQSRIKSFHQLLKEVDRQNYSLQFLQSLVKLSPIVHLDENNEYGVVSIKKYEEMAKQLETSKNLLTKLQRDVYEHRLRNQELEEKLDFTTREHVILKENEFMILNFLGDLKQNVQDQNVEIQLKNEKICNLLEQIQKIKTENSNIHLKLIEATSIKVQKPEQKTKLIEIDSQTQYWIPEIKIQRKIVECKCNKEPLTTLQSQKLSEKVLLEVVQQRLQSLCDQLDKQLEIISQQHIDTNRLKEENIKLTTQNLKLRQQLEELDQKKQKLKVWKSRVNQFVQKMEDTMRDPSQSSAKIGLSQNLNQVVPQQNEQEIKKLQAQNISLLTKIAQMKLKFKSIQNLMIPQEEVIDEGPVNNLLKLTQKIKSVVKGLIYDNM